MRPPGRPKGDFSSPQREASPARESDDKPPRTASAAGAALFLPGQLPWLEPLLGKLLRDFTGHALLLHGAPGDGAHELALRLGQAWLCEDTHASTPKPCGRCASCHLYTQASHTDQHLLMPEELALAHGLAVDIKAGRKPSKQIRVDEVRAFIDGLTTTTGRGRGKALVILPAESMNAVAASALLKTLEEPPGGTRIVLSAAEPGRLLPTLRSRCQHFRLPKPPADQALDWLGQMGVASPEVLLRACGGHPLEAQALFASGMTAEQWLSLPLRLVAGEAGTLSGRTPAAMLEALGKLCHDAMAAAVGAEPVFFAGARFPAHLELMRLSQWQRSLQGFARHAEHPWNEPLLAAALAREAQEALRGTPVKASSQISATLA